MTITLFKEGTGKRIGTINKLTDLRRYAIKSCWVDRGMGVLCMSVVELDDAIPILKNKYVCYRNGIIKKDGIPLEKDEVVDIGSNKMWSQAEAILWAFEGCPNFNSSVIHLNGDKNDNRLENLRWQ